MVHALDIALWIPPRRNTPYRPHGPRMMGSFHAIKWHVISIIYRKSDWIRGDHEMFWEYQGKHADSAGMPIPGLV